MWFGCWTIEEKQEHFQKWVVNCPGAFKAYRWGRRWMEDAMMLSGYGGDYIEGRGFPTKETATVLSRENHLELLPRAPLSHKNGCNLRKLCTWQGILLESEGSLIFFSYVSSWMETSFSKKDLLLTWLSMDAFLPSRTAPNLCVHDSLQIVSKLACFVN